MSDDAGGEAMANNLSVPSDGRPDTRHLHDQRGGWPAAILLAATFFVAIAPTLSWLEFSASMENLVVATSLEIRRTGNWLLPTLEGEPRLAKPPLAAWISAASIRCSTDIAIDSPDPVARAAAYRQLAWEVRWPGLATSCLMLLAIFDLGKTVAGVRHGLFAMAIAGSTLYFFRYGRQVTTDVQLALWTSVANAALARICLRGTTWPAALVAGTAMGLALMSKGPVCLLQCIVPATVFLIWQRRARESLRFAPLLAALALMLLIGVTWFPWVLVRVPAARQLWMHDLARAGRSDSLSSPLSYSSMLVYMMPWSPLFVHALIWTGVDAVSLARKKPAPADAAVWIFPLLGVTLPVVIMSFFADREERYLLPMLAPAAVLTARSLDVTLRQTTGPKIPPWVQWVILLVIAVGLPAFGMTHWAPRVDGRPWFTPAFGWTAITLMTLVLLVAIALSRRQPIALLGATVVVMLVLQPVFNFGYRDAQKGRSDMRPLAEVIRGEYPTALLYNFRPDSNKRASVDFSIYLNRSTIWTSDPTKLPPTTRPQVYIKLQNKGEPEPAALPGWDFLAKTRRDSDWYHAFVRNPLFAPATTQQ